ncbi:BamA/TamA family outer membrane protein [Flavihumibacter sp. R14]|nr:BamA/TamA family outer membrane protein [Flavihumibacter soli]
MIRKLLLCLILTWLCANTPALSQSGVISTDSIDVRAKARYDSVSKSHRSLFGENFRKEWAAPTRVQVIKISETHGGLTPIERGGGHQTRSLRLKDKSGKEWVLRSIEKYPDVLLPEDLRETFAKDWLNDNMSAQHPYSALMLPVLAEAVAVPHANPVIGYVSPDPALGEYSDFAGTICLLEEREPAGNSDNTVKMLGNLDADNENQVDSVTFLRARLLDLFIADWDRHEDQWRWADTRKGKGKYYVPVPRDRDDALFVNEGLFPWVAAKSSYLSFLQGFDGEIKDAPTFFYNGRKLDQRFLSQFSKDEWMQITSDFVAKMTDDVIRNSIDALPQSSKSIRYQELFDKLKVRRENMPEASEEYYRFLNRIVDIQTSDKHEFVAIKDTADEQLLVSIYRKTQGGELKNRIYHKVFDPAVTKEIRLFTKKGKDSVVVNNPEAKIRLRIVGGEGEKDYFIGSAKHKVRVYENLNNAKFSGELGRFNKHLSADSSHTEYVHTNLYNLVFPFITLGYNTDDGLILGLGLTAKYEAFRKLPYGSLHRFGLAKSISTGQFDIDYRGEWLQVWKKTDITVNMEANSPTNVINFFGRGNETELDKTGDYKSFYRARFDLYDLQAALRFNMSKTTTTSVGATYQYYDLSPEDNIGRFIANTDEVGSYDSLTLSQVKQHAGLLFSLEHDRRNYKVLPTKGLYLNMKLNASMGMNSYSESFLQFMPELALYMSLDSNGAFVLSDRIGGTVTAGETTFYQSAFLGGQGNLLGFHKYRFAGQHMVYNNLELRIRFAKVASYVIPGEVGMLALYDVGRVFVKDEDSNKWHQGVGAGLYFAPVRRIVIRGVAGYSTEGWYPYINLGFRF